MHYYTFLQLTTKLLFGRIFWLSIYESLSRWHLTDDEVTLFHQKVFWVSNIAGREVHRKLIPSCRLKSG